MKLIILVFILHISSIILLPSSDIWDKFNQHIEENKTLDFGIHFIFDEENYTALDINDDKMKQLYHLQDNIFFTHTISTYIFAIKNLNASLESLDDFVNNIRDNLNRNNYDIDHSIFAVIIIEQNDGKFYIGKKLGNLYNNNENEIKKTKEKVLNNTQNKNYYNAWKIFLEDINIYGENSKTIDVETTPIQPFISHGKSTSTETAAIVLPIVGGVAVIGTIGGLIYAYKRNKGGSGSSSDFARTNTYYNNNNNNNYYDNNYNNNNYSNHNSSIGGHSVGGNNGGGDVSVGKKSEHSFRV